MRNCVESEFVKFSFSAPKKPVNEMAILESRPKIRNDHSFYKTLFMRINSLIPPKNSNRNNARLLMKSTMIAKHSECRNPLCIRDYIYITCISLEEERASGGG